MSSTSGRFLSAASAALLRVLLLREAVLVTLRAAVRTGDLGAGVARGIFVLRASSRL